MWASWANAIKHEYNSIIIWPRESPPFFDMDRPSPIANNSAYVDDRMHNPSLRIFGPGNARDHNLRISQRTLIGEYGIDLHGWPSRGGCIILENIGPADFDYLQLDPLDPPLRRDPDQSAEDVFCQKLLRLGATWWDSERRLRFICKLENGDEEAHDAVAANERLEPTRRERGWVRVAWPSHPPGALCVLDCEKIIMGRNGKEKMRPRNYGILRLARTMDERCIVLQRMGGIMYSSIEEYSGPTFIKAWEDNHHGEVGKLIREEFIDPAKYGGRPDDALNRFVSS
jgi:hypothetical protein